MSLRKILFPRESRFFPGQRWVNISLRTLHLVGLAGLGGGFLYPVENDAWRPFLDLILWSGIGLVLVAIWNNGTWLIEVRGQAILAKLVLLAFIPIWPELKLPLFLAVVLLSGVISHAPASVRHYSITHSGRIDSR